MTYTPVFICCVIFVELFFLFRVLGHITSLVRISRQAADELMSSRLDDAGKEAFARQASLKVSRELLMFIVKFVLIVGILYAVYLLSVALFPDSREAFLNSFRSPLDIAVLTVASVGYVWVRNVIRRQL